ncbi:hypothetical protein FRC14_003503 [Serendipita sp. 396]|nr:hypothetical protein FRC14_003503 [Serendipita sp. 396]KAG8824190.1 hypothetical protein FRC19_002302 [Serendipita sp. 401]KAG8860413.1 hypothetical protein FRB91_003447 [Serendipita sp. 411]KAG9056196.1 hypothetical protein FS842_011426 [Serendipita sp. 407]
MLGHLYSDLLLYLASFLDLDSLLNFSITCRWVRDVLYDRAVTKHWMDTLPSALLYPSRRRGDSNQPPTDHIPGATRRTRRLRAALSANSNLVLSSSYVLSEEKWGVYISETGCMFSIVTGRLRCIDLRDGNEVGTYGLPPKFNRDSLSHGFMAESGHVIFAYAYEKQEEEEAAWYIDILSVSLDYTVEGEATARFQPLKQLRVPSTLEGTNYNVLQINKCYLILSGGWSSKAFIVGDWRTETFIIHRCPKMFRTFSWRLVDSRLFVIYDDAEVSVVYIPSLITSVDDIGDHQHSFQFLPVPHAREISFVQQDSESVLVATINIKRGCGDDGGSISTFSTMSLDLKQEYRVKVTPDIPRTSGHMQYELSGRILLHRGRWLVLMDEKMVKFWVLRPNGIYRSIRIQVEQPISSVVEFDERIGMLATKDEDSSLRIYWLV